MTNTSFFLSPKTDWQKRYEALRASYVERLPARVVANRFGYKESYIHLLRHLFKTGKIDFNEVPPENTSRRRNVTNDTRAKIRAWRVQKLSAGQIAELLSEEGVELSIRTVERVLAEEGFPKLPRRTKLKIGLTVQGAVIPDKAQPLKLKGIEGQCFESNTAGLFLFVPFMVQLGLDHVVREAKLPGTKVIGALNYFLSFLGLKLIGNERYAHVGQHAFDPVLGLFAQLNRLPKCTALSTYSYGLDEVHIQRLQKAFVKQAFKLGLYDGKVVNLDFHTVPHYGDESVLEKNWAGARSRSMKGALTLLTQDADSKLLLYTDADIKRSEADDQVMEFISFWRQVKRGVHPTLVFDSRFTTYAKLSELNQAGIKFITLRRRGAKLLREVQQLKQWQRVHIPHAKRKYPNPQVHVSNIKLRGYEGELKQVIMRGNGREKPTFLISTDLHGKK